MQDEEDLCAAAVASYIVLVAAHGRGLAGTWDAGRAALAGGPGGGGGAEAERITGSAPGPAASGEGAAAAARHNGFVTWLA